MREPKIETKGARKKRKMSIKKRERVSKKRKKIERKHECNETESARRARSSVWHVYCRNIVYIASLRNLSDFTLFSAS